MLHPRLSPCLVLAALSLLVAATSWAVPAPPFPIALENSDGTKVMAHMLGDERLSWFEDLDGFAIALDPETRTWRFARLAADGRLEAGPYRAGQIDPRSVGLQPHLRPGPARVERALRARPTPSIKPVPLQGTVPNLVLLVKFKNQTPTHSAADFEAVFNGEAVGTVRDYYRTISFGHMDLVSTIVEWIELPNDDTYYAYNDYVPFGHPQQMLFDAIAILNQRGFDFTRFDSDGDGVLDAIDIIHSGPSYETTGNPAYIHSHYAPLFFGQLKTHDNIAINGYHTEAELGPGPGNITQIGVITHETAHFFGLPDLYDYGYDSAGLGLWCLMSAGSWGGPGGDGTSPSQLSAWGKVKLGFLTPTRIDQKTPGVRLTPAELSPEAVLIKGDMPGSEYFLLEDRQRIGYDAYLPGDGLLIFHVDEMMNGNDDQNHYLVDLEQADGRRDLNRSAWEHGDDQDPFPLPGNSAFTPDTTPASLPYLYSFGGVFVTDIARQERDIVFSVDLQTPLALGAACSSDHVCRSGYCSDGVCCSQACSGTCQVCSAAHGSPADGTCGPATGTACDDGNPCTLADTCAQGACQGGSPMPCEPINDCHEAGQCDPYTGACSGDRKPDGTACDDGNACTVDDVCKLGFCQSTPVVCASADECHLAGACDPASGQCSSPPAPDGTSCSKGECKEGVCSSKCGCSSGGAALPGLGLLIALRLLVPRRRRRRA